MQLEKTTKLYEELFSFLDKNKSNLFFDTYEIENFKQRSNGHLFGLKLQEQFGFNIDPKKVTSDYFHRFTSDCQSYNISISIWGEKHNRTITCSDDRRQPEDEMLLHVRFSTGAYIFGDHYPTDLFNRFFAELKTFEPKYCDTTNRCLYFSLNNAANFYNNFESILKKYYELDKAEEDNRKIEKLKKKN